MTAIHLPRNRELIPISKKANSLIDCKAFIDNALRDDKVVAESEPFITNGGVKGDKWLDFNAVLIIVMEYDDKHGGNIRSRQKAATKELTDKVLISQLVVCLRRLYELDKKGKYIGPNLKRYVLLESPRNEQSAS